MTIIQKPIWTNYEKGRNGKHPELICVHIIGLPGVTAESAYEHFSNPASEVSAHYIIKRTGEIWQCVLDGDVAWSNGSISFRNGKPILPTNPIAKRAYQTGVRINQISLSLENEGSEYEDITPAQYEANVFLIKELSKKFNIPIDSTHICGHREIKQEKLCPGRISVGKIISMCNEPIAPTAPTIPAVAYTTANIVVNPPLLPTAIPSWMENLIWRTKNKLSGFLGLEDRTFGAKRSSEWSSFRRAVLAGKSCAVCGGTKKLELHHIQSFAQHPELELDLQNVIPLCESKKYGVTCHQFFGHLGDYKDINPEIRKDAEVWKTKLLEARKVV